MAVIKKTVALHPILDSYIRKMWATLIEEGYDSSYSTALNYMILEHILSVAEDGISDENKKLLQSFLDDDKSIQDLNLEDYANTVDDIFKKKEHQRKR